VYNVVTVYPGRYGIEHFVFLIDKEHIKSVKEAEAYLSSLRIKVKYIEDLGAAFIITGNLGHHRITTYTAVLGRENFIEEDVAELIKLTLGVEIKLMKKERRKKEERA